MIRKQIQNNICSLTQRTLKKSIASSKSKSKSKSNNNNAKYNSAIEYLRTLCNDFYITNTSLIQKIFNLHKILLSSVDYKITQIDLTNPANSIYKIPPFTQIISYLFCEDRFNIDTTTTSDTLLLNSNDIIQLKKIYANGTTKTKSLASHIYNKLNESENTLLAKKINASYLKCINDEKIHQDLIKQFPSLQFHTLLLNSFTSFKILDYLEECITTLQTISITYKNNTYPNLIYLFSCNANNDNDVIRMDTIIKEMLARILFFNELLGTSKLPNKMVFFLTDLKKSIDHHLEMDAHFKTININSAVTNGIEIIIYRSEELLKSIFHELIHFHNLDFKYFTSSKQDSMISSYINTSHNVSNTNKYLLYEAITEALANVLNTIYSIPIPIDSTTSDASIKTLQKKFIHYFSNELLFSIFHAI